MKSLIIKKTNMDKIVLFVNGVQKEEIEVSKVFSITVEDVFGNVDSRRRDGKLRLSKRKVNKLLKVSDIWHKNNNKIIHN